MNILTLLVGTTCKYKAGDIIFRQGDVNFQVYRVQTGMISETTNKQDAKSVDIGIGNLFGTLSIFASKVCTLDLMKRSFNRINDLSYLVINTYSQLIVK